MKALSPRLCSVELPDSAGPGWGIYGFVSRPEVFETFWLGGRDSNPDSQIQSLESYHWTTSQQEV